jgi:NAD(P)-dependent dehydrogenase (short-subunit alcohol dehydrogenase family)
MERGTVLVTGASRGIGAAIATELAAAGYLVGCVSRTGRLPEGADPRRMLGLSADVVEPDSVRAAYASLAAHGPLRGVVNNAGVHSEAKSAELSLDDWSEQMAVNARSVLIGCQAAFPYLVAQGGGLIVNIGSFFDKVGVKRNLAYSASKAAVGAITRVLAVEWAGKGIRSINVAPGYILTDLNREALGSGALRDYLEKRIPGGRPGTAEEVGRFVASLFVVDSPFLTGETIYLDGGQGMAH